MAARRRPPGKKHPKVGVSWSALAKRLGLSEREARFCVSYATHFNGARAVRQAGYEASTADSQARQGMALLRRQRVRDAIDLLNEDRMEELRVTHASVIGELVKLAFANIGDFIDQEGARRGINLEGLDRDDFAPVSELTVDTVGQPTDERIDVVRTKLKLVDKTKALELLGRHLKMFTDKHELHGVGQVSINVVTGIPAPPGALPKDEDE